VKQNFGNFSFLLVYSRTSLYAATMKHGKKAGCWIIVSLLLCAEGGLVWATSAENPYTGIVERNVFGLKPPSAPPVDPSSIKPPPPKVILNGISTIFGTKKAILKMTPPAEKGQPAKEQSFILSEGQRDGELEVIQINENAGAVLVNDYGTVTNLTFDANGPPKTASSPTPTGAQPPAFGGFNPPNLPGNPSGGMRAIPTRTLRLPGTGGPTYGNPQPSASNEGGANLQTQGMALGGAPGYPQPPQEQNPVQNLSPEAQAVLTEAAYQQAKAKNDPTAAIYPPSAMDPTRNATPQPGLENAATTPGNTDPNQANTAPTPAPIRRPPWRPGMPF
jgi:hypothetical protein